jgi:hypothetical protein
VTDLRTRYTHDYIEPLPVDDNFAERELARETEDPPFGMNWCDIALIAIVSTISGAAVAWAVRALFS